TMRYMSRPLNPASHLPAIGQGGVEDGGTDAHLGGERLRARAPVAEPAPPREVLGRERSPECLPLGAERGAPLLLPPLALALLGGEPLTPLCLLGVDRGRGRLDRRGWGLDARRLLLKLRLQLLPCPVERRLDVAPNVAERDRGAGVDRHIGVARAVVAA